MPVGVVLGRRRNIGLDRSGRAVNQSANRSDPFTARTDERQDRSEDRTGAERTGRTEDRSAEQHGQRTGRI